MKTQTRAAIVALSMILAGCSSIIDGTHQDISILSTPEGAHCDLFRKGQHLAAVDATPGITTVKRTKDDITMTCTLVGYEKGTQLLRSGGSRDVIGNVLIGGVIGWGIDSATGADNEYPYAVNIQLVPTNSASQSSGVPR
jgi:hypothetical protein